MHINTYFSTALDSAVLFLEEGDENEGHNDDDKDQNNEGQSCSAHIDVQLSTLEVSEGWVVGSATDSWVAETNVGGVDAS